MAEYLIQGETLDNIANAINAKTGGSSAMTPAEMVTEIESISGGGSAPTPNIAEFFSLVPAFDDTWVTAPFSLLSYPADGQLTIPNPLGEIPDYMFIIKTDISLSDLDGIIGGYNFIGGLATDSGSNRNVLYGSKGNQSGGTPPQGMFGSITINNWNFVSNTTPAWTEQSISFRCGNRKNTTNGYCLGNYLLAVKKVSV